MTDTNQLPTFSNEEFISLLSKLNNHHALFYQLWLMGKPSYSDRVSTAAVSFDQTGTCINFIINYDFWQRLSDPVKVFIIGHESAHVILNHGFRGGKITDKANIAMDVVVNHLLVNRFSFIRKEIDPDNNYCWIDTVFKEPEKVLENQSFEYYYNLLNNGGGKDDLGEGQGELVDSHDGLQNSEQLLEELGEHLSEADKESIEEIVSTAAGKGTPGLEFLVPKEKVVVKRKWESVIKKWASKYMTDSYKSTDQWLRTNRRFVMLGNDFFLPTEMETDDREMDDRRIECHFYQDTSGSCSGYKTRFFKAAESLPKDRFDIVMHCFDTQVYETTLESRKLFGFGGTDFQCIENHIQRNIKKGKKYPLAVFVITDGIANSFSCEKPKNWYWFLTPNHSKRAIPKDSRIFLLNEFE